MGYVNEVSAEGKKGGQITKMKVGNDIKSNE